MKITTRRAMRTGIKAVVAIAGVSLVIVLRATPALAQLPTTIDLNVPFGSDSSSVVLTVE